MLALKSHEVGRIRNGPDSSIDVRYQHHLLWLPFGVGDPSAPDAESDAPLATRLGVFCATRAVTHPAFHDFATAGSQRDWAYKQNDEQKSV